MSMACHQTATLQAGHQRQNPPATAARAAPQQGLLGQEDRAPVGEEAVGRAAVRMGGRAPRQALRMQEERDRVGEEAGGRATASMGRRGTRQALRIPLQQPCTRSHHFNRPCWIPKSTTITARLYFVQKAWGAAGWGSWEMTGVGFTRTCSTQTSTSQL